ncbi:MAG: hypothetical protein ACXWWL_01830 [Candidatus Limnocylindria bacterium]
MKVPWRIPLTGTLAIALLLAGCGGGGGGGADVDESIPDSADASSEDEEGTVYPLREGRYRMGYSAPDCEDVHITITGADGVAVYDASPRAFTVPVRLETGEYTIAVTSDCDDWTVDLALF